MATDTFTMIQNIRLSVSEKISPEGEIISDTRARKVSVQVVSEIIFGNENDL